VSKKVPLHIEDEEKPIDRQRKSVRSLPRAQALKDGKKKKKKKKPPQVEK